MASLDSKDFPAMLFQKLDDFFAAHIFLDKSILI